MDKIISFCMLSEIAQVQTQLKYIDAYIFNYYENKFLIVGCILQANFAGYTDIQHQFHFRKAACKISFFPFGLA